MNETTNSTEEFNSTLHHENSQRFVLTENLEPYYGKQIAWSFDGTQILASANSHEELIMELQKANIPTNRVVFDYIDDPEIGNF